MFRRTQVFVGDHIPPHADHIDVLMKSFVSWLNTPEAIGNDIYKINLITLISFIHYMIFLFYYWITINVTYSMQNSYASCAISGIGTL